MSNKLELYNLKWEPLLDEVQRELWMIRKGGRWIKKTGGYAGNGLYFHYKRLQELLWPSKEWHRWNELLLKKFIEHRFIGIIGPASCVAGHTRILNPITGDQPTIAELCWREESPVVMTLAGAKRASVPFVKGVAQLYELRLADGSRFTTTAEHRVLTESGYRVVSELRSGQFLLSYDQSRSVSISESFPSGSMQDALHSYRTIRDYQFDCPAYSRSYGEPLQYQKGIGQELFPSKADVPEHNRSSRLDDLSRKREYTHLHQSFCRPSNSNECFRHDNKETRRTFHCGEEIPEPFFDSFQLPWQSELRMPLEPEVGKQETDFCHMHPNLYALVQRSKVVSIRPVGFDLFYDMMVPGPNHYFAEGAIHHNSGKTHEAGLYGLCTYYAFPDQTTILCSSTERDRLEERVWGEIKKYHKMARAMKSWLPGQLIESRQRIVSDERYVETEGRDFRNGLVGIPCKKGGSYVGMGAYVGIKNKRVILIADEGQFMPRAYVDAISNLNKNAGFQGIVMGNPKDTVDALGMVCEPAAELGGWDGGIDQTGGTKEWPTRFPNGVCIQLVGSDSPNMDFPEDQPPRYPFLITREAIANDIAFYGRDSLQFSMMNDGRMPRGQGLRRVITRQLCERFGAMGEPIWVGEKRTKIGFLDAAYGSVGGDRCIFGEIQFGPGLDKDGKEINLIHCVGTLLVPVSIKELDTPEDQITKFCKDQCERRGIIPENFGFDSTGRGSLMGSMARLWSAYVVPIEFGGKPSERPVSADNSTSCRDFYSKFVSELWWSVRLCVESGQLRGMTEELLQEGTMREWKLVPGNRVEVETKADMKEKMGRSPDLFDGLVTGVEMARRKGFVIAKLGKARRTINEDWQRKLREKAEKLARVGDLNYRA